MRSVQLRIVPRVFGVFVLLGALFVGGPARATTVLPLSLEDLVERSDVIAHVRIGEVRIVQRTRTSFRVTTLHVLEGFDGVGPGQTLELWQRGDGNTFVIGDPWLEPGEEGLAFLRRVDGVIYLTALAQSFWWIEGQGDEATARRDLRGLEIVPLGAPRVTPPNRSTWDRLRQMVLDSLMGVQP